MCTWRQRGVGGLCLYCQQNSIDWGSHPEQHSSSHMERLTLPVDRLSSTSNTVFVFCSPLSLHSTALDDVHTGLFVQHSSFFSLYYMTNVTVVTCILKQRLILLITRHPCDRPDWEKCLLARKHARRQLGQTFCLCVFTPPSPPSIALWACSAHPQDQLLGKTVIYWPTMGCEVYGYLWSIIEHWSFIGVCVRACMCVCLCVRDCMLGDWNTLAVLADTSLLQHPFKKKKTSLWLIRVCKLRLAYVSSLKAA